MLLTGSKEESTLNFYRNAGYNSSDKTAFIQWIDKQDMKNGSIVEDIFKELDK